MKDTKSGPFGSGMPTKPDFEYTHEDGTTWMLWYYLKGKRSQRIEGRLMGPNAPSEEGIEIGKETTICGICYVWKGDRSVPGKKEWHRDGWIPEDFNPFEDPQAYFDNAK